MKKSEHDDLDRERITEIAKVSPELAKAIISAAPLKAQVPNKRRKPRKQSPPPHQPTTKERIYHELDQTGFGYATAREWLAASILPPHPKIDWTQTLEGYEAARVSAENAMRRIWAATGMAQAGYEGDPWLGTCLFKMRVGMVQRDHRDVLRCVQHAQKIGKAEWFSERLAEETKNAKKRVRGAPWFNRFRASLVNSWLSDGCAATKNQSNLFLRGSIRLIIGVSLRLRSHQSNRYAEPLCHRPTVILENVHVNGRAACQ